ncbi:hypothetical protein [Nocardia carnea]|nr:hypothetical protein [Nocardia carnea]
MQQDAVRYRVDHGRQQIPLPVSPAVLFQGGLGECGHDAQGFLE